MNLFDEQEEVSIVLAVNSLILEYFKEIDIFKLMQIITNSDEIANELRILELEVERLYFSSHSTVPAVNYFIVKATDEAGIILKVIQENLHYVKILKAPDGLKEEIKERINLYFKNEEL